ncbi:MAG: hypothetical protein J3R72DRAFT_371282, partial [Linnemannia gamsii]
SSDSDLETFSHNPTDDSFGPLPAQVVLNTNYPDEWFLSYKVQLQLHQHFCLTMV